MGLKYFIIGHKDDKKVIYNGHVISLDETNRIFLFQQTMLYWKKIIKSWIKSVAVLKKDLIVNECTMKKVKKKKKILSR